MQLSKMLTAIGLICRVKRKAKGLNQINAAKDMGIDYRHYQNIEGGKINMRIETLLVLMKFYEFNLVEIKDLTDEEIEDARKSGFLPVVVGTQEENAPCKL